MIIRLRNLRSSNTNGQRKIHVDIETNSPPDTAKLEITISGCGEPENKDVAVDSSEVTYDHTHQCQGQSIVTVRETTSGLETEKVLNLDAIQSS